MKTRYLGVDLGTKRIGFALSDPDTGIVSPLRVIEAGSDLTEIVRAILDVASEYGANGVVIGLPLNMDGTEGPQARRSRSLAEAIRRSVADRTTEPQGGPFEIHLHDERLTSHAADDLLTGRELTRKKKKRRHDALAAQVILQSFLEPR